MRVSELCCCTWRGSNWSLVNQDKIIPNSNGPQIFVHLNSQSVFFNSILFANAPNAVTQYESPLHMASLTLAQTPANSLAAWDCDLICSSVLCVQEASISHAAAKQPFYGATPTSSPKVMRKPNRSKNPSTSTVSVTSLKEVCSGRGLKIVIWTFLARPHGKKEMAWYINCSHAVWVRGKSILCFHAHCLGWLCECWS